MRIVQVNNVYPEGSTGKIVLDINHFLTNSGHEAYVLFGIGNNQKLEKNIIKVVPEIVRKFQSARARVTGYPYGGCIIGTHRIKKLLKDLAPDVVHLHCINGYIFNIYKVLNYLKKKNIPTVLTLHAEFMYTGGCSHTVDCNKWLTGCYKCQRIGLEHPRSLLFDQTSNEWKNLKDSFDGFENLVICPVSDWLKSKAKMSPFFQGKSVETVLNGLNTDIFYYRTDLNIRKRFNIPSDTKIILHVTPDFFGVMKGGKHVLEMAKRFEEEKVVFFIVGLKKDSINLPHNVISVGHTTDQNELAEFYSMADICILTSVRETFSMVCAESLCCGTPVVGFKSGAPETISIPEYSEFVEQGNDTALEKALRASLAVHWNKREISREACKRYDRSRMCKAYMKKYKEITDR